MKGFIYVSVKFKIRKALEGKIHGIIQKNLKILRVMFSCEMLPSSQIFILSMILLELGSPQAHHFFRAKKNNAYCSSALPAFREKNKYLN